MFKQHNLNFTHKPAIVKETQQHKNHVADGLHSQYVEAYNNETSNHLSHTEIYLSENTEA